jgi:vacuolar-type H+-ATPase subunit H
MARRAPLHGAGSSEGYEQASTLAQIRDKELEFDGLVMVARSEAETRLREAQELAERSLENAESEAAHLTTETEIQAMAAAQAEADAVRASTRDQLNHMREVATARHRAVVDEIVRATLRG